ncbi:MAG: EAL domain-containing protein, partial [Gallionellaceae bacterium]
EFLKIDGSIIRSIHRDPVEMAKVIAINRVAKKIGVKTIAEFVETEETIAKLKEVGIDFAQGFGISKPRGFD